MRNLTKGTKTTIKDISSIILLKLVLLCTVLFSTLFSHLVVCSSLVFVNYNNFGTDTVMRAFYVTLKTFCYLVMMLVSLLVLESGELALSFPWMCCFSSWRKNKQSASMPSYTR